MERQQGPRWAPTELTNEEELAHQEQTPEGLTHEELIRECFFAGVPETALFHEDGTVRASLYRPDQERDACGVGVVCQMSGAPERRVVAHAKEVLCRLDHRGAALEDGSGDGAGVLVGMPDAFLRARVSSTPLLSRPRVPEGDGGDAEGAESRKTAGDASARHEVKPTVSDLPPPGEYAVGSVFLPKRDSSVARSCEMFQELAPSYGLRVLGWRNVSVRSEVLGTNARGGEPLSAQVFVVDAGAAEDAEVAEGIAALSLDQRLFVFRKAACKAINAVLLARWRSRRAQRRKGASLPDHLSFYVCSLSRRTLVYKGQLTCAQLYAYFDDDLNDERFASHVALVHSRFSTNTFPSWPRAQPNRLCCHNGEFNTLRGNLYWQRAREALWLREADPRRTDYLAHMLPVVEPGQSNSGSFDNVLELISTFDGDRSLAECVMMMMPEAWENRNLASLDDAALRRLHFYAFHQSLMEAWDGPALVAFTDGRCVGASLDRNGLRPGRFYVCRDGLLVLSSEVGVIPSIPHSSLVRSGRLEPGKMFFVDFERGGVVVDDAVLKAEVAQRLPYRELLEPLESLGGVDVEPVDERAHPLLAPCDTPLDEDAALTLFGYTVEQMELLLAPMAVSGTEALGSMGNDQQYAAFDEKRPRLVYDFFKQLFAQVTNPAIDPIREGVVMSLRCYVGPARPDLLLATERPCAGGFRLEHPLLTPAQYTRLVHEQPSGTVGVVELSFDPRVETLRDAIVRVCEQVEKLVAEGGRRVIVLSDRALSDRSYAGGALRPISAVLACGAVHHHVLAYRSRMVLVVDTAEAREVHHFAVLLGYGADAVHPYMAYAVAVRMLRQGLLGDARSDRVTEETLSVRTLIGNFRKAVTKGLMKVMAKMGISTLQSYKGAQVFEVLGLDADVIHLCFRGSVSRIEGVGFATLQQHGEMRAIAAARPRITHAGEYHWRPASYEHVEPSVAQHLDGPPRAVQTASSPSVATPTASGSDGSPGASDVAWRSHEHTFVPSAIADVQEAARRNDADAYRRFAAETNAATDACLLRGMLGIRTGKRSVPLEKVEPASEIVKRFCTGAMSYGSIAKEPHEAIAQAMNSIGAKSNCGEGGEDSERFVDDRRSAIKQIASGRFGVTSHYLSCADDLQIKISQGAKCGEGGELPGKKVTAEIARVRRSTPGVGLISPPPHHDIYSIEDLAELLYDLRNANPEARLSVKLVSESGVGVVAAGVAKAHANHILIAAGDGGTGAARWTGIKYTGLPWELGVADAHQTLVINDLRKRVVLQADGGMKTGRDVVHAALLGAEEFGFGTMPLVVLGCIMMRKCHLGTCPVGIATQDPVLRAKFAGAPEHVVNYLFLVAEEVREYMASMGFTRFEQMIGRSDLLFSKAELPASQRSAIHSLFDLRSLLTPASSLRPGVPTLSVAAYTLPSLEHVFDQQLIAAARQCGLLSAATAGTDATPDPSVTEAAAADLAPLEPQCDLAVVNVDRSVGTLLSFHVSKQYGGAGVLASDPPPRDHPLYPLRQCRFWARLRGSAGQSLGAFLAAGLALELHGDCNDYPGKGLSGGVVVVRPQQAALEAGFEAEHNVIAGNAALYGATGGFAFFRGMVGERFAVRNSGAVAVVEGVGDHGCEYMTGGRVMVLGRTGINFGAGMSGGVAYVLDADRHFLDTCGVCNRASVSLASLSDSDVEEQQEAQMMLRWHHRVTGSAVAERLLALPEPDLLRHFVVVFPDDYRKVVVAERAANRSGITPGTQEDVASKAEETKEAAVPQEAEPAVDDIEDLVPQGRVQKVRGFLEAERRSEPYRDVEERVKDWEEIWTRHPEAELKRQTARCMDCGVPFCESGSGCPLQNKIPEFNELVYRGDWRRAYERLSETNNFPEFTGRVCPAPCEGACVLGVIDDPVTIKSVENAIAERAFAEGWVKPVEVSHRTGRTVAVIGSGPAGLAAADMLNRHGHTVTVYERDAAAGGLLRYGIPNMKLDKSMVQRRVSLLEQSGVRFVTGCTVGSADMPASQLVREHHAVLLATGATVPRALRAPGAELDGVHFAMEFLGAAQRRLDTGEDIPPSLDARGKHVVIIGSGDTGCDCIATAVRLGAQSVTNFSLLHELPSKRAPSNPWPEWPRVFRVEYGHREAAVTTGVEPREYCVLTKAFQESDEHPGRVGGVLTSRVQWSPKPGAPPGTTNRAHLNMRETSTQRVFKADLVLFAIGYSGPEQALLSDLAVAVTSRSSIDADASSYHTSVPGIFAAGDCRRGQSLVVNAIAEGRAAAASIHAFLANH